MIIGAVVMTGYDVVFDRTTTPHRVGFASSACGVPTLASPARTPVAAPHARGLDIAASWSYSHPDRRHHHRRCHHHLHQHHHLLLS
jgi:hypothetical protein